MLARFLRHSGRKRLAGLVKACLSSVYDSVANKTKTNAHAKTQASGAPTRSSSMSGCKSVSPATPGGIFHCDTLSTAASGTSFAHQYIGSNSFIFFKNAPRRTMRRRKTDRNDVASRTELWLHRTDRLKTTAEIKNKIKRASEIYPIPRYVHKLFLFFF